MKNIIKEFLDKSLVFKPTGRTPVYDYLRCFAVVLVIAFHNIGMDLTLSADMAGTPLYSGVDYARWLCFTCNELFIMLSGALLIKYKDESLVDFYKKRFLKIVIPLVVYYLFYLWHSGYYKDWSVAEIIMRILTGETSSVGASNFWLIYYIIGLYFITPFLRKIFKNVTYRQLTIVVIVGFILTIVNFMVPGASGLVVNYLGWLYVAILGYWCSREETGKIYAGLAVTGLIAAIALYFEYIYDPNYLFAMDSLTPIRIMMAVGIFSLFFKLKKYMKDVQPVRLISKYSYGIMLIHNLVIIEGYSRGIYKITSVMYKGLGALVCITETLVISLILAFIIDNTILKLLTRSK